MLIAREQLSPDVTLLKVTGRLILGNDSQLLERCLVQAIHDEQRKFILDLSQVDLLDSIGVGSLVVAHSHLKKVGGRMRVVGARGVVETVLHRTSVDKLLNFFPTVEAALVEF